MNFREIFIRLVAITTPYLYDNNVSLLELVRKLYEHFHKLCEALKSFEEDYSKFKEETNKNLEDLKAYVDNYFNNLDLNAEVKTVIDSLIADGTLANLINQDLLGNINEHLTEIDNELKTIKENIEKNTTDITNLKAYDEANTTNILKLKAKDSVQIASCEANSNYVITNDNLELNLNDVLYVHFNKAVDNTKDATLTINNVAKNVISKDGSLFKGSELENTDLILKVGEAGLYQIVDIATLMTLINQANTEISSLQTLVDSLEQDVINNTDGIDGLTKYMTLDTFEVLENATVTHGTVSSQGITLAKNYDGSVAKLYGTLVVDANSNLGCEVTLQTSLRPKTDITINCLGIRQQTTTLTEFFSVNPTIHTDGTVTFSFGTSTGNRGHKIILFPCLLFIKDFGDKG